MSSVFGRSSNNNNFSKFGSGTANLTDIETSIEAINVSLDSIDDDMDNNKQTLDLFFKSWRDTKKLSNFGIAGVNGVYTETRSMNIKMTTDGSMKFVESLDKAYIKTVNDKYFLIVRVYIPEFMASYTFSNKYYMDTNTDGSLFVLEYSISPELIPFGATNNNYFSRYLTFLE